MAGSQAPDSTNNLNKDTTTLTQSDAYVLRAKDFVAPEAIFESSYAKTSVAGMLINIVINATNTLYAPGPDRAAWKRHAGAVGLTVVLVPVAVVAVIEAIVRGVFAFVLLTIICWKPEITKGTAHSAAESLAQFPHACYVMKGVWTARATLAFNETNKTIIDKLFCSKLEATKVEAAKPQSPPNNDTSAPNVNDKKDG